ncbi:MAG TPA: hypothetical protein PKA61_02505 [Nitrospira sp.]|nr:hypothetical protein [Nitrospira sp.]
MRDVTVWAAWYLFLLAVPLFIVASLVREQLLHRRSARRAGLLKPS